MDPARGERPRQLQAPGGGVDPEYAEDSLAVGGLQQGAEGVEPGQVGLARAVLLHASPAGGDQPRIRPCLDGGTHRPRGEGGEGGGGKGGGKRGRGEEGEREGGGGRGGEGEEGGRGRGGGGRGKGRGGGGGKGRGGEKGRRRGSEETTGKRQEKGDIHPFNAM